MRLLRSDPRLGLIPQPALRPVLRSALGVAGSRPSRPPRASPGSISLCTVHSYRRDADEILLQASPILDFGKIIIYTNNLKIIRAPMDQKELMRRIIQTEGGNDWAFGHRERRERFGGGHKRDVEIKAACSQYVQVRENRKCFLPPRLLGLAAAVSPPKPHLSLCLALSYTRIKSIALFLSARG